MALLGFYASGRFTIYSVQKKFFCKKKDHGKKYLAAFCRHENGKNQIMLAITSAIADCQHEFKRLKLHFQGQQNHITHKPISTIY